MKRYIPYIPILVLCLLSSIACSRMEIRQETREPGYLYVNLNRDDSEELMFKSTKSGGVTSFILKIYDDQDQLVRTVSDASATQDVLALDKGSYSIEAVNTESPAAAAFDSPYYYGKESFDVIPGQVNTVNLTCSLANVKVTAVFSDEIKADFASYTLTVSNGEGQLVFSSADGTIDNEGYFSVTETLTWTLVLINNDGLKTEISDTYSGIAAKQHYNLSFSLGQREEVAGTSLTVVLDDEMTTKEYDVTLDFSE